MKKLLLLFWLIVALAVVAGLRVAYAQEVKEFSFDTSGDGWSCHSAGGFLWPETVCQSPVVAGRFSNVGVVAVIVPDLAGAGTLRLRGSSGAVLCESSFVVGSERVEARLFCDAVSDFRLEIDEGAGDFMIDFVRLDLVSANPPTATPSPTATPAPTATPSPTATPAPVQVADPYLGMIIPPTATPAAPTATPTPDVCQIFFRVSDDVGAVFVDTVQVRFLSDRGEHFRTIAGGFSVDSLPCASGWLSVSDLQGRQLSDPMFITFAGGQGVRVDLVVNPLPLPDEAVAVAVEAAPVVEVLERQPVSDTEEVVGVPPGVVAMATGARVTPSGVVPVVVRRGGVDLVSVAGVVAVALVLVLVVWIVFRRSFRKV